MIMGEICTRRCPFVMWLTANPIFDLDEPRQLAEAVAEMQLKYVVVTSVDRDDLKDSGAGHFAACIEAGAGKSYHHIGSLGARFSWAYGYCAVDLGGYAA